MEMISTIHGELPLSSLSRATIDEDAPDGHVTATEYYLGKELVRRDVLVHVKPEAALRILAQELNHG